MRFHFMFRCFCFFFLCILLVSQWTHAQESFSDEELAALSDAELELICLVRGFELVKDHIDEATGEKYELTHDDYVDAAKQCLAVEEEMNALLDEHPELREELEEEIRKMKEEQAARIGELEKLEEQLSETDDSGENNEGTAFIPKQKGATEHEGTGDFTNVDEEHSGGTISEADDESLHISEEEPIAAEQENSEASLEDDADGEFSNSSVVDSDPAASSTSKSNNSEVATGHSSNVHTSLPQLAQEILLQVKKDIDRVVKIMIPVFKPMLKAGDLAMEYIKAAISSLQKAHHANKQKEASESNSEAA